MSNSEHSLTCNTLTVVRGGNVLFTGLNLHLQSGDLLMVQGSNGAGKSTLLETLSGLLPLAEGEITFNNAPLKPAESVVYLGHKRGLYQEMSVQQNVKFWADLAGGSETVDAALHYFDLEEIADFPVHMLSEGWKQRVALTRLLTMRAPIWLLDEPTANLDDEGISHLHSLVSTRLEQKGIVVMTTHASVQGDRHKTLNINDYKITSHVIN